MYHDLCIPYTTSQPDLQRTLSFLLELSYTVIAISLPLPSGSQQNKQNPKLPSLPPSPPGIKQVLTRLTLPLLTNSDLPTTKLHSLQQTYDLVALRPTSEKTLLLATSTSEPDLISLDLSARWPFHFRPRMFSAAVKRGVYFEICYSAATTTTTDSSSRKSAITSSGHGELVPASDPATARRNLIANATSLVRALRGGRNVVFSSEASNVLGLRAPMDVVNLGVLLGISAEVGMEAVREAPAMVVRAARARREGWRGVVLGVQIVGVQDGEDRRGVKRKVGEEDGEEKVEEAKLPEKPLSKRQAKRMARRERAEKQGKVADAVASGADDKT